MFPSALNTFATMKSFWSVALVAVPTALSQVIVIQVGSADGALSFSPSSVAADVGSFVQFQFNPVVYFHGLSPSIQDNLK